MKQGIGVRTQIVSTFAEWTALSALRLAPIRSRKDVYTALRTADFTSLFNVGRGPIKAREFDEWHHATIDHLIAGEERLNYGWAAKILNVYLKTRAYIAAEGREGLSAVIHPPIDGGLWDGLERQFAHRPDILQKSNCVRRIKDIDDYECYSRIIDGCRLAAAEVGCSLIEVEQFWTGTEIKEVMEAE